MSLVGNTRIGVLVSLFFNSWKLRSHLSVHSNFRSLFVKVVSGAAKVEKPSNPRKLRISETLVGADHLLTTSILAGSTDNPYFEITWPRNWTLSSPNSHLENLAYSWCSAKVRSIVLKYSGCSSRLLEYIRILSINTITNFPDKS